MKKSIIIFVLLFSPFLASAQWSLRITAGAGPAIETAREVDQIVNSRAEYSMVSYGFTGYSFQAGMDLQYFISSQIGLGTGLAYQYSQVKDDDYLELGLPNAPKKRHLSSIKIPFALLWSSGSRSHHSLFSFGLDANISLMSYKYWDSSTTDYYLPFFSSLLVEYSYRLGTRFSMGILINRDINWYSRTTHYNIGIGNGGNTKVANIMFYKHLFSAKIMLSYRLFKGK